MIGILASGYGGAPWGQEEIKRTSITEMNNRKIQESRLWLLNDKLAKPDKDTLKQALKSKGPLGGY